jgi:hypothetical protein
MKAVKQALLIVGALLAIMAWAFLRFAKESSHGSLDLIATVAVFVLLWVLKTAGTRLVAKVEDIATRKEPGVEPTVWPLKWFLRITISFVAICMGAFFIVAALAFFGVWGFFVALVLVPFFSFWLIRRNWGAHAQYMSNADKEAETGKAPSGHLALMGQRPQQQPKSKDRF